MFTICINVHYLFVHLYKISKIKDFAHKIMSIFYTFAHELTNKKFFSA
jgi:hypothetical protein